MGWTYEICVKDPKFNCNMHENNDCLDEILYSGSISLTGDGVFDRENLGTWMQLTDDERRDLTQHGYVEITRQHVTRARKVLEDVTNKIKSMPFDVEGDAYSRMTFDDSTKEYVTEYYGNPLNIEILKVIDTVFAKDYHVRVPWRNRYTNKIPNKDDVGVPYMIKSLDNVLKYYDDNPNSVLLLFLY